MDVKEIERLKKLVALFDSANAGERTNAIDAAGALLKSPRQVDGRST